MADQGNSSNSNQFFQGSNSRPMFPNMEFRPISANDELDHAAAERRRLKKMNAQMAASGLNFGDNIPTFKPLPRPTALPIPDDRVLSSPRAKHGIPKVKPPSQDHLFEKSRGRSYEKMRLRERLKMCQSMCQSTGKLQIPPNSIYDFTSEDLLDEGEIGRGAFGTVNKMVHRKSDTVMAVKRIRSTVDEKEQKQLLMDLEVVMKSNECSCIVQFYGALFKEGDCWICMELMDTSLDKLYKHVYEVLDQSIPESVLGKITVATVTALNYLKEKLKIIHRDVKPSNILLDRRGNIKLCDFGISGQLVDSIARTRDAGCRPYMAPERIDPQRAKGYDVRSDVWSLGITLMEVATGRFPYPRWNSVFEQLYLVVQGDPPRLTEVEYGNSFTPEFVSFVNTCLIKEEMKRPKYDKLLEHPFIRQSSASSVDVAAYVTRVMDTMGATIFTMDHP
ncbi:dual specificity mitogen-activated protein kinase kinase 4-like isoform X2 [Macrosteles quadrilineatus]|uniref:dual specificity mitogen-activated protein kinase kinase 4-like isoform X2 n=1 Tax=Macrosteles quadrilineatus TaxID=74068 RepID=UPI0023E2AB2B|nr:dual specificity mitogen-activated protein kinase kinase 4-like isoform X2 [Macrosteles quadrilineatus]